MHWPHALCSPSDSGLSIESLHTNIGLSLLLAVIKLVIMPLIVLGLAVALGLSPLYTIAAVICAAVPTAKTVYILAGEYRCEEYGCRHCLDDHALLGRVASSVAVHAIWMNMSFL